MSKKNDLSRVLEAGIVAVVRSPDSGQLVEVCRALVDGGVHVVEITMTVPGAIKLIEQLAKNLPGEFFLGAGTVLDPETARQVILAGATYIVAPTLNLGTIAMCHRYDVAAMPGCFTPTEILTAWEAGADVIKVFPATALGPGYFKDIRAPMPQLRLMPTGGVTLANAGEWIKAGAVAIGVGSALVDTKAIDAGNYAQIAANARHLVESVRAARA
jgi:2-dehydro-3-deoxyphosphogluconate aldolase/(4S)-4-hydroxy-2-oxoglutarate aldolase